MGKVVRRVGGVSYRVDVLNSASFVTMSCALQTEQIGKVQVAVSSGMITSSVIVGRVLFDRQSHCIRFKEAFALTAIFLNTLSPVNAATLIPLQES